jgi:beta-glucosidase
LLILTLSLEWGLGYDVRFGMIYTHYVTLERTPKKSALMIEGMIKDGTVA